MPASALCLLDVEGRRERGSEGQRKRENEIKLF